MNKRQLSVLNMMVATCDYCKFNPTAWAALPNFSALYSSLDTVQAQIHALASEQMATPKGITKKKNQQKQLLIQLADETASRLRAYAHATGNGKLEEEMEHNERNMARLPDNALPDTCTQIYKKAEKLLNEVGNYQVTEATQAALLEAITSYKLLQPGPRAEQVIHAQQTYQIDSLFVQSTTILESMDILVNTLRHSNPDFYTSYHDARRVIMKGTRNLALQLQVNDQQTHAGLKGVKLSLYAGTAEPAANDKAILQKITAKKGGSQIRNLASGAYLLRAEKAGYSSESHIIYINDGETTELNLWLEPLA